MGRRLGQHFLVSSSVLERIAIAACPQRERLVIEIGPGQGALTEYLLDRADRVIAIELDEPLVESLKTKYPTLELVHSDILDVDLGGWGECVIAGNLPYYITSPIIEKILSVGRAKRSVLMVQKEVAERLTAQPGTRDYGFLTVTTQSRSKAEYLFTVTRGAFRPPPKVDSAVVRLTPLEQQQLPEGFLAFAGLAFRQKRKTLRNNLISAYPAIGAMPEASLRAEQLSVPELQSLHLRLLS